MFQNVKVVLSELVFILCTVIVHVTHMWLSVATLFALLYFTLNLL